MRAKEYELTFLPLFEEDLSEIVDYISFVLQNPVAADNFVNKVQQAINDGCPLQRALSRIILPKIDHTPTIESL